MSNKKIMRDSLTQEVEKYDNLKFNITTKENLDRIYIMSLKEGESYYLRLIITQSTAEMSFKNLRTVDDVVYNSYEDTAKAIGLLKDDMEWNGSKKFVKMFLRLSCN